MFTKTFSSASTPAPPPPSPRGSAPPPKNEMSAGPRKVAALSVGSAQTHRPAAETGAATRSLRPSARHEDLERKGAAPADSRQAAAPAGVAPPELVARVNRDIVSIALRARAEFFDDKGAPIRNDAPKTWPEPEADTMDFSAWRGQAGAQAGAIEPATLRFLLRRVAASRNDFETLPAARHYTYQRLLRRFLDDAFQIDLAAARTRAVEFLQSSSTTLSSSSAPPPNSKAVLL